MVKDEDLLWVQATLQGDREAFRAIVAKYHPMIFDLCRRTLRQTQEAEDVTQEVFVRAFRKLSTYQLSYKFSTWLYTVALNVIRNQLRRQRLVQFFSLDAEPEEGPGPEPLDRHPKPEETAQQQEASALLDRMLQALKPKWRTLFLLYYVKDLSCQEIAQVMGVSEGVVKVSLHRARRLLQEKFKGQLDGVL
ncbi:MAG: RNA polymerase sigma factor [Elusimicrobia bacterium]|nr:RNA polymerase sigma factor [Elusimicrobiota bacterium]